LLDIAATRYGRAMKIRLLLPLAVLALVGASPLSAETQIPGIPPALPPPALDDPGTTTTPAEEFFATLAAHCGQAFPGRVLADQPASADTTFTGKPLVMHLHKCSEDTLRIGFHVGDDHSRTWVLTRRPGGLRLKHDHRHADGSADAMTMYGGDTLAAGSATRQEFPADAESIALFAREGRTTSRANVWALEVQADRVVYELARPDGRLFRVAFDLRTPQLPPPPVWGD
jgi:hypothetical protein